MSRCRRNSSSCVERILVRNPLVQWTGQRAINHHLISVFVGFGDISTDCQPATRQHYGLYITHHHHLVWFCAREAVACCSPDHPNCFRVSSCCLTAVVVWCSAAPIIIITWCFDFCVGIGETVRYRGPPHETRETTNNSTGNILADDDNHKIHLNLL